MICGYNSSQALSFVAKEKNYLLFFTNDKEDNYFIIIKIYIFSLFLVY